MGEHAVLLTRPAEGGLRFAKALQAGFPGLLVVQSPLQEIRAQAFARPDFAPDAVIFTSSAAIAAGKGAAPLAFCVGDGTAIAAQKAGFAVVSAGGNADDLVALLAARPAMALWHLRGAQAVGDVAGRLRAQGHRVADPVVYAMADLPPTAQALALLARPGAVLLPLFSPLSARRALAALWADGPPRAALTALCLSPAVADVLPETLPRRIAAHPNAAAMAEIVAETLNSAHRA